MSKSRIISVDCRFAGSSGIGVYLRNILTRLYVVRPDWRFRLLGVPENVSSLLIRPGKAEAEPLDAPYYSIAEQCVLKRRIGRSADLVWSPHYNAALFASAPLLVTVHDVNHLALPHLVKGIHRRLYAKGMFEAVRRRADGLLFDSEFSRKEFIHRVGPLRQPNWIIYNAVGELWTKHDRTPPLTNRNYIIYVGNIKPHKNLLGLLKAFATLKDTFDIDLVIVGQRDGFLGSGNQAAIAAAESMRPRVVLTGSVSDQALVAWVENASALVLPSFYEGFGIPPLEAMAVSCPTVVSRAASLPEVCAQASEYVDPHDHADIVRGIAKVLGDAAYADRLREAGRERITSFSWEQSAKKVAIAMESLWK